MFLDFLLKFQKKTFFPMFSNKFIELEQVNKKLLWKTVKNNFPIKITAKMSKF